MLIYMCLLLCQQSFVTNHLNNKKGGCLESRRIRFFDLFPCSLTKVPSQVVTISRILTPLTVTRCRLTPGEETGSGWEAGEQTSFIKH